MAKLGQYNLDEMTEQEAFDACAQHLLNQREKSENLYGHCLYKGQNVCCAAAIFIQGYDSEMEGSNWIALIDEFQQTEKHKGLIIELQNIHD